MYFSYLLIGSFIQPAKMAFMVYVCHYSPKQSDPGAKTIFVCALSEEMRLNNLAGIAALWFLLHFNQLVDRLVECLKMPHKFITGWRFRFTTDIHFEMPAFLVPV